MALSFHTLPITERREETADSVSIGFSVPPELRAAYQFSAGQFVTLRTRIDDQEQRRSYSICSAEQDYAESGVLRVGIKRVNGGLFSNWANDHLKPGQSIDVMTPDGRFTTASEATRSRSYLGFAGGSGITPMLSLIHSVLGTETTSRFTLIYGNRNARSIMFLEALEDLKNRYLGRMRLYHVLAEDHQEIELFNGMLDQAKCAAFLDQLVQPDRVDEVFICGPEPMMNAAEAALIDTGMPISKIRIERFGSPVQSRPILPPASPNPAEVTSPTKLRNVVIVADGKSRQLQLPDIGISVLDAGLAAGIDLPYACKGGVCCTCRARVLEGEVVMDKNYTLEPNEVAQGFVLTCQCHPRSDRVVLSYDERL